MNCIDNLFKILCIQLKFEILVGQPFATWFEGCIRIDNKKKKKKKLSGKKAKYSVN
jgi:hypothetical protein